MAGRATGPPRWTIFYWRHLARSGGRLLGIELVEDQRRPPAFLEEHKYEQGIRASYQTIIDTFSRFPHQKYVFEASGYTIDQMAKTPLCLGRPARVSSRPPTAGGA